MKRRQTVQRKLLLESAKILDHPTAADVYDAIHQQQPNISMATVYRNLNLLDQEGLLSKLSIPGSADRFDGNVGHHYHMICSKCKKIFDIDVNYFSEIDERVHEQTGLYVKGHDIVFVGTCIECTH